jgi:small subunit ribosomal protein S6e
MRTISPPSPDLLQGEPSPDDRPEPRPAILNRETLNFHNTAGEVKDMAKFKVIVSDPETGTSKAVELEEARAAPLIGKKIGEVVDGSIIDQPGHKAQIMGGSDKDGFPMRPSVHGGVRRRIVLSGGVGFNPTKEGMRKRKTIRGNVITDEIVQINMKITEKPKQTKETKKPKEKKEEKPTAQKETQPQKPASTQQQPDTTTKT